MGQSRGYFGLGVEGLSKPMNAGSLLRTAHAFGASFTFAVAPYVDMRGIRNADTSATAKQVPFYQWDTPDAIALPKGCQLVGVELLDQSIDLPSFRHPEQAAYVLGPERGSLSPEMVAACDFVIKIPMSFCINVGIAGAITLYDRMISRGRFAERPVRPGGPTLPIPAHVQGAQRFRTKGKGGIRKAPAKPAID